MFSITFAYVLCVKVLFKKLSMPYSGEGKQMAQLQTSYFSWRPDMLK